MCRMALCVAAAVFGDGLLLPIDTNDQAIRQRVKTGDRSEGKPIPVIGCMCFQIRRLRRRRGKSLQCIGDAAEQLFAQAAKPSASSA